MFTELNTDEQGVSDAGDLQNLTGQAMQAQSPRRALKKMRKALQNKHFPQDGDATSLTLEAQIAPRRFREYFCCFLLEN